MYCARFYCSDRCNLRVLLFRKSHFLFVCSSHSVAYISYISIKSFIKLYYRIVEMNELFLPLSPFRFGSSLPVNQSFHPRVPPHQSKTYFLVPMIALSTVVVWKVTSDGNLKLPQGCIQHHLLSITTVIAICCWQQHLLMGNCGSWNVRLDSCKVCMNFLEKFSLLLWSGNQCLLLDVEIIMFIVWIFCMEIKINQVQFLLEYTLNVWKHFTIVEYVNSFIL